MQSSFSNVRYVLKFKKANKIVCRFEIIWNTWKSSFFHTLLFIALLRSIFYLFYVLFWDKYCCSIRFSRLCLKCELFCRLFKMLQRSQRVSLLNVSLTISFLNKIRKIKLQILSKRCKLKPQQWLPNGNSPTKSTKKFFKNNINLFKVVSKSTHTFHFLVFSRK